MRQYISSMIFVVAMVSLVAVVFYQLNSFNTHLVIELTKAI